MLLVVRFSSVTKGPRRSAQSSSPDVDLARKSHDIRIP
jgi:hypothetical protein